MISMLPTEFSCVSSLPSVLVEEVTSSLSERIGSPLSESTGIAVIESSSPVFDLSKTSSGLVLS